MTQITKITLTLLRSMVSKASCLSLSLRSLFDSEAEATPPTPVLPPARCWKSMFASPFFYRTIKSPSTPIYLQGDNIKRLKIKVHMNIYNHQYDIGSATLLSLIHRYSNSDITLSCKYKAKRYVFHVVKELSTISCSDCKREVFKIINISFISSQCYGSFICLKLF